MKTVNTLALVVVFLAVGCVGMHLYIVETELNDVRQTQVHQAELNGALEAANHAIVFATETQYIAVMAEERAAELASKLDIASLIVATLEEQLEHATSVVESQCEQLRDLIDLNSELQTNSTRQDTEMDQMREEQGVLEEELIDALRVAETRRMALVEARERLVEARERLNVAATVLSMRDIQLEQADARADELATELQQSGAQLKLTTVQLTEALAEQAVLQARLDEALAAIKRFRAHEVLK